MEGGKMLKVKCTAKGKIYDKIIRKTERLNKLWFVHASIGHAGFNLTNRETGRAFCSALKKERCLNAFNELKRFNLHELSADVLLKNDVAADLAKKYRGLRI